jgi:hypothetical protein
MLNEKALLDRLCTLERRLTRLYAMLASAGISVLVLVTTAVLRPTPVTEVVRTRQLIVEDVKGRARVILGAPIHDNFDRVAPTTGMAIRDSTGAERFGVGVNSHGSMNLGLDAPRCTGQPCNVERISLDADNDGGSHIRLLDRHTGAAAVLHLAEDDRAYLEFAKLAHDSVTHRRIGLLGDTTITEPLR